MASNIKDVAQKAGVSPSTVSRVITDYPRISQETRKRVFAAMKELNYHPNAIARSLVTKSSKTIGLVMPGDVNQFYMNPFFPEVLRGITDVAQNAGYDLLLSTSLPKQEDTDTLQQMMWSKRVDGVILLTVRVEDPLLDILEKQQIPVVLIGRPPEKTSITWVNNNNKKAAYDSTMHLLKLGHKRIGFIGGSPNLIVTIDRRNGYAEALQEFGIAFDPNLVVFGEFLEEAGYMGMMRLLAYSERPTSIVASDDVLAFGAMQAAGELGYNIPDDLAIVGFNDIPLAKLANPPMTTVNVFIQKLGQTAANLLIERLSGEAPDPKVIEIEHELVIRRSCGAFKHQSPFSF